MKSIAVLILSAVVLMSGTPASARTTTASKSAHYTLLVTELQSRLQSPWGMAFLPDKRMLVTQKSGQLLIISADGKRIQATLGNLPAVAKQGQGGLLDVALDPGFADNGLLYWSYAEPGTGKEKGLSGTAVARGRLQDDALKSIQVIYRQKPKVQGNGHFGSRLLFGRDNTLYITLGDRQKFTPAQDMAQSLGKVVRINSDGSVPKDNPKWTHPRALAEVYSLGHRNPQGAALHPLTGELWLSEHGPQGGDEINRVLPGRNYGWPSASYGCNYGEPVGEECRLGGGKHAPKYVEPLSFWVPVSVAPSNLIFYSGQTFSKWQGHVLMGTLAGSALWRVQFSGTREVKRERLLAELGERIRDVEQGPDGMVYLLTDSGKLLRLSKLN